MYIGLRPDQSLQGLESDVFRKEEKLLRTHPVLFAPVTQSPLRTGNIDNPVPERHTVGSFAALLTWSQSPPIIPSATLFPAALIPVSCAIRSDPTA